MKNNLISIIVPVYNVDLYLRDCLDSIVNQTYRNIEIIIVDDGSSDNSGAICDEYGSRDNRIKVIHQANSGVSEARNVGLDIAIGDYILFVDSDDWIDKEVCETVLELAIEQNADIVCFGQKEYHLSGNVEVFAVNKPCEIEKTELIKQLVYEYGVIRTGMINKFYSSNLFRNIRFPKGRTYEDVSVFSHVVHLSHKIYVTNAVFHNYIVHEGSIMSDRFQKKGIQEIISASNDRLELLKQHYPQFVNRQIAFMLREMIIGKEVMRGSAEYPKFLKMMNNFVNDNKSRLKSVSEYSRLIWLWYYCPPLASLYVRLLNRKRK